MNRFARILVIAAGVSAIAAIARAQVPGFDNWSADSMQVVEQGHVRWIGNVVFTQPDMKFFADQIDYYTEGNRLVAEGNVLLQQSDHQIASDRADFNAVTRLGTFFNARGFAALGVRADISQFGTLTPDVQFYGKTIEKIAPQTYLISHGGFTTCAQANPRWEMTSGSIKLRLDHYALLRNMLLKAKGVPVLFLPALYYPIGNNARQTGFLMPSYGSSSYRGQVVSNGFFWAIGRSQDATILHDWYSKTGQAINTEYRYVSLKGGGNISNTYLNEKPTTFTGPTGIEQAFAGTKSFTLNGSLSQGLAGSWYAQARANYFSSLAVHQRSTVDINQTSVSNRILGGSTSGTLAGYRITGTYDRNEYFPNATTSSVRGSSPRITVQRPDRLIGRYVPVYASVTNEYVHLKLEDQKDDVVTKNDIDRLDILSTLRFPINKLTFMPVNTTLSWRNTFWSDSRDPLSGLRIDNAIARSFFEMAADVNGPSVFKIWSSRYLRFKHTVEPVLQVVHRTPIDNTKQILNNEYVDSIVGNMTSYSYGAATRLYAKRTDAGPLAVAREVISASIRQTYSTDANAILNDQLYRSTGQTVPTHFSPVRVDVRAAPMQGVSAGFRTEFDGRYSKFRQFGADGSWNSDRLSLLAGWSEIHFVPDAHGINILSSLSQYLNTNTTVRFKHNRFGILHSFNWDIRGKDILQQRIAGYYNAQCCGFTGEWQTYDFTRLGSTALVPQDRRFHFSVTLAGIGNVSNIFGALAGTPNR